MCAIVPKMFGMNAEEMMNLLIPYYQYVQNTREAPSPQIAPPV